MQWQDLPCDSDEYVWAGVEISKQKEVKGCSFTEKDFLLVISEAY